MFLASALGGGLLLALATNNQKSYGSAQAVRAHDPSSLATQAGRSGGHTGVIRSALIGLAAAQAKNVLAQLIAGSNAHPAERKEERSIGGRGAAPPPQATAAGLRTGP